MNFNLQFHGFQFFKTVSGNDFPTTLRGRIASGYGTAVYRGQPVVRIADGTYTLAAAGATNPISGVVSEILQFRNANGVLVRNGRLVPAGTTYTDAEQATMVEIIPVRGHLFRVCSSTVGAALATARAWEGENVNHVYGPTGGAADAALGLSGAFIDVSTHNVDATFQWRLRQLFGDEGGWRADNNPALIWQQWIVEANLVLDLPGLPAVLGV